MSRRVRRKERNAIYKTDDVNKALKELAAGGSKGKTILKIS